MAIDDRYERRKAKTRRAIIIAANQLFDTKGYEASTMEDISVAADVAVRTIYLHFDSKAAVLLAGFDGWLDDFVERFATRPPGESLDQMMSGVLAELREAGWTDDRPLDAMKSMHPVLEFIGRGGPEIAGHIMHGWVAALNRLAEIFRERGGWPPEAIEPRIQASSIFASWMSSVLVFREHFIEGLPLAPSSHDVGEISMRAYVEGLRTLER